MVKVTSRNPLPGRCFDNTSTSVQMSNRFPSSQPFRVWKSTTCIFSQVEEQVVVESPLEIQLAFGSYGNRVFQRLAVTMRTPGSDFDLVRGFLFCEGIIRKREDIVLMRYLESSEDNREAGDTLLVELHPSVTVDSGHFDRRAAVHSACSLCGRESMDMVSRLCPFPIPMHTSRLAAEVLCQIPGRLEEVQGLFSCTGGSHAAALFDFKGNLIQLSEDVGRHNALDKLIGYALEYLPLPLHTYICLMSGRVGFELVQKAGMAGIGVLAAVGAPTSLAIEMAEAQDIALVGFLREAQFNVYSCYKRIQISEQQ